MMLTVFLFSCVWQWTDTFYASLVLNRIKLLAPTLSSWPKMLWSGTKLGQVEWVNPGFASMVNNTGSVLVILPIIIVYLFTQKYFIEGVERSGIVG